jgi:hypothetical protein
MQERLHWRMSNEHRGYQTPRWTDLSKVIRTNLAPRGTSFDAAEAPLGSAAKDGGQCESLGCIRHPRWLVMMNGIVGT